MSHAASPDWMQIVFSAAARAEEGGLSKDDGAALESRVAADENDVDARVRLVGFYFLRQTPECHRRRAEHVVWLARHRPDIKLLGFGYIQADAAPAGHEAACRAWTEAAARADADIRILENAATFLGFNRPEEAEPILRRAAAMEPENAAWRERIAQALTKRAEWASDPAESRRHARAAIAELEIALSLEQEDWEALGVRIDLTNAAVRAEDWARAREVAERVLIDNETCTHTFQHGNAIHWANIALGWAALAEGRIADAATHLVRAGKTPGSPQLNNFGPELALAQELLDRGERAAVSSYLAECARFWKGREALLERWRASIERGDPTELEDCDEADAPS